MCKNIRTHFQLTLFLLFLLHHYFQHILQQSRVQWNCVQVIYLLTFFYAYNFHSLNIKLPALHDLSYSHSQLIGFQINFLSHTSLSINSLHSHLPLSSFQRCFLLQTLASNPHLHLHVSCHYICLVSLVLDITLNTLTFKFFTTSGTHNFAYGLLILLQLPLHLLVLILKG